MFFLLHKCDKSLDLNIEKSKNAFKKIFFEEINDENKKKELDDFNVNKFSSKLYNNYREFKNKYIKDFELFLKYIIDNSVKMEERKKIKNYLEFLNLMNRITKKLTFHINKKLAKKNENKIKYDSNLNGRLFNVYKSLNIESCSFNDNSENFKNIEEIYSNYLYIYNNYKLQNQRVLSNAEDLYKSLYKIFKDSYEFTENQFKYYFYLFVERFNNLFILIDIKLFGNQLKTQLILDKIPVLINKTKEIYKETLESMEKSKSELYINNNNISNDNIDIYEIEKSIKDNMTTFSDQINNYLAIFVGEINSINEEYKKIINSETTKNITINSIIINFSEKYIDRDTDFYKKNKDESFFNFLRSIGNLFKKEEKINQNISHFKEEINSLIEQCCKTFNSKVTKVKDHMINKFEDTLMINGNEFDGLKNNRKQYDKIKDDYYRIIRENSIK